MSDDTPGKYFCSKNNDQCHKCSGHNCNDELLKWQEPLSCVKCTSTENENCETAIEQLTSDVCALTVSGYTDSCYTRVVDQVVERGCYYEASEQVKNECQNSEQKSCIMCNEPGCNKAKVYIGEYCYKCDSATDPNCTDKVKPSMETKCDWSSKGCYLIRENNEINREY